MSNLKMLSAAFTALVLALGAGCAADDGMESSMHKSEESAMSGSMDDGMSESSESMDGSESSHESGSMSDDGSGMSDTDSSMSEPDSMDSM